ncbi:hypothetical protein [Streptococcus constellatus]|uniref:hypothetical protein n=1 Tax=Streptococcus constellatus TaxID=76860 RepID=UPI0020011D68|nr:hypothetical protein [Streptococcus constellatus]
MAAGFAKVIQRKQGASRWDMKGTNLMEETIYLTEDDDIRTIGEVVDIYREG